MLTHALHRRKKSGDKEKWFSYSFISVHEFYCHKQNHRGFVFSAEKSARDTGYWIEKFNKSFLRRIK